MLRRTLIAAGLAGAAARSGTAAPAEVLVLGDSLTAGFGLAPRESMPARLQAELARRGRPVRVLAAGVFGDTAGNALGRIDGLPAAPVTVVALGANDLLQGIAPARTEAALRAVVRKLTARGSRVVLAGGRSPFGSAPAFEALFARVARAEGVILAPDVLAGISEREGGVQADGLHPDARGAELIALRLAPAVFAALEPSR